MSILLISMSIYKYTTVAKDVLFPATLEYLLSRFYILCFIKRYLLLAPILGPTGAARPQINQLSFFAVNIMATSPHESRL